MAAKRRVLRLIVLASLAFAGLVLAVGVLVAALSPRLVAPPPPVDISTLNDVQAGSAALPLDAAGVGTQVVGGVALTYRLSPAQPLAGQAVTLTLIALDLRSNALIAVTPTLSSGVAGSTTALPFQFSRNPDGAYVARGNFFGSPAKWRLRSSLWLNGKPDYITLIDVYVP